MNYDDYWTQATEDQILDLPEDPIDPSIVDFEIIEQMLRQYQESLASGPLKRIHNEVIAALLKSDFGKYFAREHMVQTIENIGIYIRVEKYFSLDAKSYARYLIDNCWDMLTYELESRQVSNNSEK